LLKNPRAGEILDRLQWFQTHRLQIHAQVVVCPGINDGTHLERTLLDLAQFHQDEIPAVASVAVVPVGLTRFRPTADELVPVTTEKSQEVIALVQPLQEKFRRQLGTTFAWLADEWFLIGRQPLPPESHYEDYPQIGNGVGSIRQFLKQFRSIAKTLPATVQPERRFTWVVGNAVEQAFQPVLQRLNQVQGLQINLAALRSDYWGQQITVTGLLTGQDVIQGLQGTDLGEGLLLPTLMLKHEDDRFLDDMTVDQVAQQLHTRIWTIHDLEELLQTCVAPL
jgi:putative radical SAM enzyme (TIGR03279 family)